MRSSWTILALIQETTAYFHKKGLAGARLDAELLLAHALGKTRIALYTSFDTPVLEAERVRFRELVKRRGTGEPIAYIVGEKEFYSRSFFVNPQVLIPRPETEHLIEQCERRYRDKREPLRFLDLGTGSGAVAVTLACEFPESRVDAIDISQAALAVAKTNAVHHGVAERIQFYEGDMTQRRTGSYDAVLVNPPYIGIQEYEGLSRDVREFEPKRALLAPEGGVYFYRCLFSLPMLFKDTGCLIAELGSKQRQEIEAIFYAAALQKDFQLEFFQDHAGCDRGFVLSRRTGP